MQNIYIASCEEMGGVYRYRIQNDKLLLVDKVPCDRPMYMACEGETLSVLLRAPFAKNEQSGVMTLRIGEDGTLSSPSVMIPSGGVVGCHIAVCDGDTYVANYISGSVSHLGGKLCTHEGKGMHPTRQTSPHTHSVVLSPCKKYVLCADLGVDRIFVYDRSLNAIASAEAEKGSGPRHMVFSKDGAYVYVVNELSSTVTVYRWCEGTLVRLHSISTLKKKEMASSAAAIRLSENGEFLYVTNRGENSVAVFGVSGEHLEMLDAYPALGDEPRDFLLVENEAYAVLTNQFSDIVMLYRHENGVLTPCDRIELPKPIAVLAI